jgi:NAD(P)-dependent dehydrogenase (short-subunit alcohol dehydrogenase family)
VFNSDNLRLDGKCAIITGAGAGIGKEIAITFATAGASVVVSDINGDAANHVVDEIQQLGGQAFACRCDITSEQELSALADFAVSKLGKVDILVNNAGICKLNKVLDFGRADWDPMIDVNLTAAFELSYEAAKIMIPQKSGKIINICSLFSYLGGQWSPAYSATKHALAGFTKAYCDELGQYNIQVNGIAPGYYATDITLATRSNPETNQRVLDHIPANRWGDTQDLMGAAVFLASPASNYVNGHLLVVDGGYLVR